ncbi:MAG: hypothetical protein JXA79_09855 [Deltaproteobacteria bacterium]|nr:hypothetical protein [Deltaproteobacteria bacterium]
MGLNLIGFKPANKKTVLIGLISLIIGILFYVFFRPGLSTYFQREFMKIDILAHHFPTILGRVGGSFPEFIHPFAFSLISMGLISKGTKSRLLICTVFFSMNLFFEFGQKYSDFVVRFIPNSFNSLFIIENTKNYFVTGTFSVFDLAAIFLGSIMAFVIAEKISTKEETS